MTDDAKPLPVPDTDSAPFWDACRAHTLVAQCCRACGAWRFPPRGVCPRCASWDFDWRELAGTGVVQTFVAPHRAFTPGFAGDVPYVIASVVMDGTDESVVIAGNLTGCAWDAVRVGMPVRAIFIDATPEITLPKFVPREP
jgi:uncharacterized OB-fold protein